VVEASVRARQSGAVMSARARNAAAGATATRPVRGPGCGDGALQLSQARGFFTGGTRARVINRTR